MHSHKKSQGRQVYTKIKIKCLLQIPVAPTILNDNDFGDSSELAIYSVKVCKRSNMINVSNKRAVDRENESALCDG